MPDVASLIMPAIELTPPFVIPNVPFNLMAAALNTSVLIVKPVSDVVPPTAPVNVVSPVPLVAIVSVFAPLTVLLNVMLPFDVVVSVTLSLNVTAPV